LVVVMMMATTFTAVATPHALVLTVSHDLLFRQPPSCAAALMPPFLFIAMVIATLVVVTFVIVTFIAVPKVILVNRIACALCRFQYVRDRCSHAASRPEDASVQTSRNLKYDSPHHRLCRGVATLVMRAATHTNARQPMKLLGLEPSRSESGDPVYRMWRLSLVPAFAL
jgi:hypothetical protein